MADVKFSLQNCRRSRNAAAAAPRRIPHHSPFAIRRRCGTFGKGAAALRPYEFTPFPIRYSPFAIRCFFHAPFAIRYSRFAVFFYSPFAIRRLSPLATRPGRWVSANGGSPTHPRTVGARHAVPLRLAYPQVRVRQRPGSSRRAMVRRQDAGATTQPGRVLVPPLPGPAPFAIRHSPFAVFSIRHSSRSPAIARDRPPNGRCVVRGTAGE